MASFSATCVSAVSPAPNASDKDCYPLTASSSGTPNASVDPSLYSIENCQGNSVVLAGYSSSESADCPRIAEIIWLPDVNRVYIPALVNRTCRGPDFRFDGSEYSSGNSAGRIYHSPQQSRRYRMVRFRIVSSTEWTLLRQDAQLTSEMLTSRTPELVKLQSSYRSLKSVERG